MPKITEMYAYIAEESEGDEGVIAMLIQSGWIPMVGADEERMKSLKPIAQRIASRIGKKVTLVKFSVREELETIEPGYIPLKG